MYCIHEQLSSVGRESDQYFEQYEQACLKGESVSERINLLRTALYSRLDGQHNTFLVLDGYDRICEGLQVLLDREFADLQVHHLRLLQTRRVPKFKLPLNMKCNGIACGKTRLKLYWVCHNHLLHGSIDSFD